MTAQLEFLLKPKQDYIELYKLLKIEGIAETGGMAKMLVEQGLVAVNGETERRKRCKLYKGFVIETSTCVIRVG